LKNEEKLTTKYRDKLKIEKINILNNYAKQTLDRGTMYYIYSNNSRKVDTYNLTICGEGKSSEIISTSQAELPNGAATGSVLREQNGVYILDNEATELISNQLMQKIEQLLQEQTEELKAYRIEGHSYEIVENIGDRVYLIDITINNGECFEEVEFPIEQAEEGIVFQYVNEEYRR